MQPAASQHVQRVLRWLAVAWLLGQGMLEARPLLDFRHAPPSWQSAICLPDDPWKSLVDEQGALLYHYGKGGNGFGTRVVVEVVGDAVRQSQQLDSPRVPIVRTCRRAPGLEIVEEAFAITDGAGTTGLLEKVSPRSDVIVVAVSNTGDTARTLSPRLVVESKLAFKLEGQAGRIAGNERVTSSLTMTGLASDDRLRHVIALAPLTVAAGETSRFSVCYRPGPAVAGPSGVDEAVAARARAKCYWQQVALPYGRIDVPDAAVQALVDASIRNLWQAREIKDGQLVFQVGPTCYRGLWLIDGAFMLEAVTMLGETGQARKGIACELSYQKPDGRMELLNDFIKENGIMLWTCVRHARLTRDKRWLESVWPQLQGIANYIRTLRQQTLANSNPLDDGLNPPGMPDGGIGGVFAEYSNPFWNMLGLRAFIEAARWLDKPGEAAQWQEEYDGMMAAFHKAAARDLRDDGHGNRYLPTLMGEPGAGQLPQRAQWGFCHAVYPGELFARNDPLVAGNLAMLAATERQDMVCGTGWDAAGIWTYFASFYGHAWLWQGDGRKAAAALYAFGNHAAPVWTWREEQSIDGTLPFRSVGDMPHNWAGADFIRLAVHLLALDRGKELHLLEGMPPAWAKPGMTTRLTGIATPFGPLTMVLEIAADGRSAHLQVDALTAGCEKLVVHLGGWTGAGEAAVLELDAGQRQDCMIPMAAAPVRD